MNPSLCDAVLTGLPQTVARPPYLRSAVRTGVVHFGPGAFHRAHQAWFVEALLRNDPRWGICAVSLRAADLRDALAPQDGLYTLVMRDESTSLQVIGAVREILVAPEDPQAVLHRLCAAQTRIVTVTVTEKGYCLNADGSLDVAHADIRRDLETPHAPVSVIGYLTEGLRRRRAAGVAPFVVVSCDNLVNNGARLAGAVIRLAQIRDADLASWIEGEVLFPRTMVDSITPATTDALRDHVEAVLGVRDHWPVQRESFAQWVIEDRMPAGTPDWQSVGVTLTNDVAAFERAKLRLLNGAHSTLAYVGLLVGHETVAQAMQDADLRTFVHTMLTEDVAPSINTPTGLDLAAYIDSILRRFRNPTVRHELAQIAWDGSQKLPFRVLGTIRDNLEAGRSIDRLCVPIAAWMQFVRRAACGGRNVIDPLAQRLFDIGRACEGHAATDVPLFLALDTVFPPELRADPRFAQALGRVYDGHDDARFPIPVRLGALPGSRVTGSNV
jgi:fructuronate reductase